MPVKNPDGSVNEYARLFQSVGKRAQEESDYENTEGQQLHGWTQFPGYDSLSVDRAAALTLGHAIFADIVANAGVEEGLQLAGVMNRIPEKDLYYLQTEIRDRIERELRGKENEEASPEEMRLARLKLGLELLPQSYLTSWGEGRGPFLWVNQAGPPEYWRDPLRSNLAAWSNVFVMCCGRPWSFDTIKRVGEMFGTASATVGMSAAPRTVCLSHKNATKDRPVRFLHRELAHLSQGVFHAYAFGDQPEGNDKALMTLDNLSNHVRSYAVKDPDETASILGEILRQTTSKCSSI